MEEFSRAEAIERVEAIVSTIEREEMAVPVREVWVYGDVALGLDPVERLDVYLTKDILMNDEPGRADAFEETLGVKGVGRSVRASWAEDNPDLVSANANGHAAPEKCLAAQLLDTAEPTHLEVCNASFEDNVTQRLKGAMASDEYEQILDPRGACLWVDDDSPSSTQPSTQSRTRSSTRSTSRSPNTGGETTQPRGTRSEEAFRKLHESEFVFPTLANALEMLGMDSGEAQTAADTLDRYVENQDGATVRGDVV